MLLRPHRRPDPPCLSASHKSHPPNDFSRGRSGGPRRLTLDPEPPFLPLLDPSLLPYHSSPYLFTRSFSLPSPSPSPPPLTWIPAPFWDGRRLLCPSSPRSAIHMSVVTPDAFSLVPSSLSPWLPRDVCSCISGLQYHIF